MRPPLRAVVVIAAVAILGGCSDRPRQGFDAQTSEVNDGGVTAGDSRVDGDGDGRKSEVRGPVAPERTGIPLPPDVAPPRRFLPANATLAGLGASNCTHQDPPSGNGDRWCAYTMPIGDPDTSELWVINVSAVAQGLAPVCDGTDPNCLRLTSDVWNQSANVFKGDTLIFHVDPVSSPSDDFLGPTLAWRPGWSQARQISSGRGVTCIGHNHAAVAFCLDDPVGNPKNRDSVTVRAGYLNDETGGPLPVLEGFWPLRNDETSASTVDFSPNGELLALSLPDTIGGVETLRVVATRDVGQKPAQEIIQNAVHWTISNDNQRVFFIRREQNQANLYMGDFPTGAGVVLVQSNIRFYAPVGQRAEDRAMVLFWTGGPAGPTFQLLRDPAMPTELLTLFSYRGTLNGAVVSRDLRFTTWADDAFRAELIRNDDLTTCSLNMGDEPAVYFPVFLDNAALMFWSQESEDAPGRQDGFFASPERCRDKQRFAQGLVFYRPVGSRGLLFGDEHDEATNTITIKYAALSQDGSTWPSAGAVRIKEKVHLPITITGVDPMLLVFRARSDETGEEETYVFGPVPF